MSFTDHPDTLKPRNNPRYPDALMLQNNLATAYQEAGRADEAIARHEQTLATCEQV